jgi:hypothetical protein
MSAKNPSRVISRERNAPWSWKAANASGDVVTQKRVSAPLTSIPMKGYMNAKGTGDVAARAQRLDEADLRKRRLQLRRAGLPLDAMRRSDQRAALAILLRAARRPVLGQPTPQVACLADVKTPASGIVHAIGAGLTRNPGEKVDAELPVEDPHAPLSQRACRSEEAFCVSYVFGRSARHPDARTAFGASGTAGGDARS